jgi:hypothetical protein
VVSLRDKPGLCIRHEGWYQQLHPESEFHTFIREQQNQKGVGAVAIQGQHYDPKQSEALPFIVLWEAHVQGY